MNRLVCRPAALAALTLLTLAAAVIPSIPSPALAQPPLSAIAERTKGSRKIDGFYPMYWDDSDGRLLVEIPRLDTEVLYATSMATGLGSNDIGIDRGQPTGSRIVKFERVGPRILMVQPNYQFRAVTQSPAEAQTVRDAFARSVLWSFSIVAASGGRYLVDWTDFLVRDSEGLAGRLQPGTYQLDASRSSVHVPALQGFPKNTELEAELTFVREPAGSGAPGRGGAAAGGGGRHFEGVGSVAATAEAASMRVHHSIVELPGPGYQPREHDPRSGYFDHSWENYAALPGQPKTLRFVNRHRLQKKDPSAAMSDPVKPIVYYVDPGAPEPIRSALLDGARWWSQAFEAAGYRDAFRVELLPKGASPNDIRYNVINWVHRSTRGWSYGATVTDPRTGEIIKGNVTLGSLRIRQDYMIAEGLLSPYKDGTETPPELLAWGLARIRQLSAHEVGHTLGLDHNYYDSKAGRISVMDYPHPLVTLKPDGSLDYSQVYDTRIGEWDKIAIRWGYSELPKGGEKAALDAILEEGQKRDLVFLTNQDLGAHASANQWSNGTNAAAELDRMMKVRAAALARFGERAIKQGQPLATLEEVLVPLYLHHRYQVEAASAVVGGLYYTYALRSGAPGGAPAGATAGPPGGTAPPVRFVPAAEQLRALDAVLATLQPAVLALPRPLLQIIPPRPSGFRPTRELFPRYTGQMFDAIAPAVAAADLTLGSLLSGARAARLVEQQALDAAMPGLHGVIDRVLARAFAPAPADPYHAEIQRAVQRVAIERLMALATTAEMPQVRAIATAKLKARAALLPAAGTAPAAAHAALLAADIKRLLDRPAPPDPRAELLAAPLAAPPGAPIGTPSGTPPGEPAPEWLRRVEPRCSRDAP
ncbi:MAG TPA: zinc-dependent metalloprotease [Kofleriaceae bacterium]|nr:zinc-dependent metalloprotease [Kofleriaceae bacterium]